MAIAGAIAATLLSASSASALVAAKPIQVAAGNQHSCALFSSGSVQCWGNNERGQLGDGAAYVAPPYYYDLKRKKPRTLVAPPLNTSLVPVVVSGISTATQIGVGVNYSCALLADQTVKCWGWNDYRQLGDGTTTERRTPVTVAGISTATKIAIGAYHSCALLADKTVKCWGANWNGELGNGTTTDQTSVVTASGISTATDIAVGSSHSCALLADQTMKCWGKNANVQLGDGTYAGKSSPATVAGITTAVQISAGSIHTCALLSDSTVKCWGTSYSGQLGDGSTNYSVAPVTVTGISTATQVVASDSHSCALLVDGSVSCWGGNNSRQLGNGSTSNRFPTPVTVSSIATATQIASTYNYSCALLTGGAIKCWGENDKGQLGDGTLTTQATPVFVIFPDTTAPDAPGSFTGVPSGQTGSTSATIGFTASETGGTIECKLDAGSWGACTVIIGGRDVTMVLTGLALGPHTLSARQTDADGNISNAGISATWSVVIPILAPTVVIPSAGTKTVYKKTVGGVKTWAIKTGLLFSTGGDTRPAAQFMTVQVAVDSAGKPVSARPSDSAAAPTSASFNKGVVSWSTTGEVTRPSTATPVWVRAGNRLGKWSAWVKLTA